MGKRVERTQAELSDDLSRVLDEAVQRTKGEIQADKSSENAAIEAVNLISERLRDLVVLIVRQRAEKDLRWEAAKGRREAADNKHVAQVLSDLPFGELVKEDLLKKNVVDVGFSHGTLEYLQEIGITTMNELRNRQAGGLYFRQRRQRAEVVAVLQRFGL